MPEVPLWSMGGLSPTFGSYQSGDTQFSFKHFEINPALTAEGVDGDEQRLLFLYRGMKKFESQNGNLVDMNNGRTKVHRSFLQTKQFRHEQRAFTQNFIERLSTYRSALEDSATFFITVNPECVPGSIVNASTLCSRNIFWHIPRQFAQDPAIREAFEQFIGTLAELSLDCVTDFPHRAGFSPWLISQTSPCIVERGVSVRFGLDSIPKVPTQSNRTRDSEASGLSSYSSVPPGYATPARSRSAKTTHTTCAAPTVTQTSVTGFSILDDLGENSETEGSVVPSLSTRATGNPTSTATSFQRVGGKRRFGTSASRASSSAVNVKLSNLDEELENFSISSGHVGPAAGCICGKVGGGEHTSKCNGVRSWVTLHSSN